MTNPIIDPALERFNENFMAAWLADLNNKQARIMFVVAMKNNNEPYILAIPSLPSDKMLEFLRAIVKAMETNKYTNYMKQNY